MGTGKLIHYGIDLILISMLLAAVRRNTGLELLYSSDFKQYVTQYLSFGEYAYDKFVSFLKMSGYFHIPSFFDRLKSDVGDALDQTQRRELPRSPPSN